jgi:hypothetical protein
MKKTIESEIEKKARDLMAMVYAYELRLKTIEKPKCHIEQASPTLASILHLILPTNNKKVNEENDE